jgi:putative restriction endonuclease
MEPGHGDPDADIRIAAFARLRSLSHGAGGAVPWSAIAQGFLARGRRFLFATTAEGIFRPVGMTGVLSIKTVVPNPKGRIWYHDQSSPDLSRGSDVFWYAFTGPDPNSTRNRWLHHALVEQLPLIYFFGVAPALYEPLFPTFVVEWNPTRLSCGLSFASSFGAQDQISAPAHAERRYALRTVQHRLHQALFRARVIEAYGRRCALSGLPEPRLIDAAHIIPDADERLGQPDIRNGICMSKVHHAAYDAGLIGIDPDLKIHVSGRLLALHDGPMLEQALKALKGKKLRLPDDPLAAPDRERLAARFDQYVLDQGSITS